MAGAWANRGDVLTASRLPPVPASVPAARHDLVARLDGVLGADGRDVAALLVSELVTNAITHAHAPITFTAKVTPRSLRVEVGDGSRTMPHVRERDDTTLGGWGLHLLDDL